MKITSAMFGLQNICFLYEQNRARSLTWEFQSIIQEKDDFQLNSWIKT